MKILTIDFETAHGFSTINKMSYSSACAIGIALYDTETKCMISDYSLISPRPFKMDEEPYRIHGISLESLKNAPEFHSLYRYWLSEYINEANLLVAHNASFDMKVFINAIRYYHLVIPSKSFACTLEMSREHMQHLKKHKLDFVADALNIPLDHHNAKSDALAAAKIFNEFTKRGYGYAAQDLRAYAKGLDEQRKGE